MQFPKSINLLFSVILLFGCSNSEDPMENGLEEAPSEDPIPQVYFTVNTYENWRDTSNSDNWLIIYDESGNVIDYQLFESGDTLIFEGLEDEISDEITITLFSYSEDVLKNKAYSVISYAEVQKGSIWELKNVNSLEQEPTIGDFTITVDNFDGLLNSFSYGFSNSNRSSIISKSSRPSNENSITFPELPLYEDNDYLFSLFDDNNRPKYKFVNDVQNGDELRLDFQEFDSFDDYIKIDLQTPYSRYRCRVMALEENEQGFKSNYLLNTIRYFDGLATGNPNSVEMGFLNQFSNYEIIFSFANEDYDYFKVSYGPKPENMSLPKNHSLTVNNSSLLDFDFDTDFEFVRKVNNWKSSVGEPNMDYSYINWVVYSSNSGFPKINDVPEELKSLYPNFNLENLNYDSSSFYIESESHQNFIDTSFEESTNNPFIDVERIDFR